MSELTTTARPYARAAFELAQAHGTFDKWSDTLGLMAAVVHDPTMRALLDSPRMTSEQGAELFISVCEDHIDDGGRNFVKLLAENDRLPLLPEITAMYEFFRAEAEGKVDAEVVSAQPVSDVQIAAIAKALQTRLGREVNITSRIDEDLLGGAIVYAGDLVIDGSVRGKLNKLSTALAR